MSYDAEPELDEGLDPEGPSAADLDRFGGEFVVCPECGFEVYDQAEVCPRCGRALTTLGGGRASRWVIVVVVVVLAVFVLAFVL
ncbi:MAG: zinc-ribbon domain-containing protein [Phycisphaerales bacterium]|nr:zinc-ribbon domain-containing protein [Phycisphaerales bacterium]